MITAPVMKELRSIYLARLISDHSSNTFSEAVDQTCSVKKVFFEIRKIHRKTPVPDSGTGAFL